MGYVVGDLAGYRAADLHPVVSEAFADYVIPLRVDAVSLEALLTRRGWEPAWSFGLFRGERLAGFWLTGRDDGRNEAYCIMTGILPEARGSGGVDALFARVLAATNARPHRLEVIRGNERAARAYRRLGFRAARVLHYYQLSRATAGAAARSTRAGLAHQRRRTRSCLVLLAGALRRRVDPLARRDGSRRRRVPVMPRSWIQRRPRP